MFRFDVQSIAFTIFALSLFTLYIIIASYLRKDPVEERLRKFSVMDDDEEASDVKETRPSTMTLLVEDLLRLIGVDITRAKREVYPTLAKAGLTSTKALANYLFFKRFIQPVLLVLAALCILQVPGMEETIKQLQFVIIGGILGVLGIKGADAYVEREAEARKKRLERSFPDTLDLLTVCIESGLPLDAAIGRIYGELRRIHPDISQELEKTKIELNVLSDRVQALENLAERAGSYSYKALVSSLIQTEKFGTSLVETLKTLSEEHRAKRMLDAERRAAKIPVKIMLPVMLCIFIPFLTLIVAPPVISIQERGGIFKSK